MSIVEAAQRLIWPGSETEIVPAHLLLAVVHNGGLVIGAFVDEMVGFVFGFLGSYPTPDGPRLKHCSHMLGVLPPYQGQGIGFALKRAQWQMVRQQGLDRITWTYDPLLSRNAYLNIARLGAICNTYLREEYGEMRDDLNIGLPSDRFQVDWWVNSPRTIRRLSKNPRPGISFSEIERAGVRLLNPCWRDQDGWLHPSVMSSQGGLTVQAGIEGPREAVLLLEIPEDFQALKAARPSLALEWRRCTRAWLEDLFEKGYYVTDFIRLASDIVTGQRPRSFYVLSHGESTFDTIRKNR